MPFCKGYNLTPVTGSSKVSLYTVHHFDLIQTDIKTRTEGGGTKHSTANGRGWVGLGCECVCV